ncbi:MULTISPECIES: hypothetical protein [Bacillaceae]|uniref:Uncharacterized protein n=1 Tax=Oceanobacillus bengalensis TaxID=1435466 RepID=A0A494YXW1_9BACI|nr:hypothetical protein [Oceanobacillus bengalensis]RKQ15065.1 hypothetical protein D8M05_11450 [Oceanobacillus bengalensis]
MLVFWGLIIWLIVLIIRKLSSRNKSSQTDKAVEVLRQRYSQREIDTEEEYKIRQSDHFFEGDIHVFMLKAYIKY